MLKDKTFENVFNKFFKEGNKMDQEIELLTIQKLKDMKPNTIFARGMGWIVHPWYSPYQYERKQGAYKTVSADGLVQVKWVAVRGGIHDWAIYHSLDANLEKADFLDGEKHLEASWEKIYNQGAKLHDQGVIKSFVPCDDEAFAMYRH